MKERIIFHIDVNSAYLSWSALDLTAKGETVDLRTIPSVVGGDSKSRRGIVLAKSIPAKKFGIVTGEPLAHALKKCPHIRIIPPDFDVYYRNSNLLFQYLSGYSDRVEIFSIDECFVDYTGMERLFGNPLETAYRIKNEIRDKFGFTVNVGVGPNKLLAKMAGELEKPDKVITLFHEELPKKLWPLPVSELYMVGRRTAPKLNKIGIFTIGQLAAYDRKVLEYEFKSYAHMMVDYANGIDDTPVSNFGSPHEYKSISNAQTTPHDVTTSEEAYRYLLALAQNVSGRLRVQGLYANGVSVMLKNGEFKQYSHQKTLSGGADDTNTLYAAAKEVFDAMWKGEPLRLFSLAAERLSEDKVTQFMLEEDSGEKQRQAELAMDMVNYKYGKNKVTRATLLDESLRVGKGSSFSKENIKGSP